MADVARDIPRRLDALLRSDLDRGALLRELQSLAQAEAFRDLAGVWAPALYNRDARFFESFLLRHLDGRRHARVIRALLPRVEAAEHDSLFQGLYRKIAREWDWNKDLLMLAQAGDSDERVLRALQRRDMGTWFVLAEETALALYRRNPGLFRPFVQAHVSGHGGRDAPGFEQLRAEARRRGDDDFYWFLFREFAREQEWTEEVRRLLYQKVPAGQVVEELRKRHPAHRWNADTGILVVFLEKYGAAVLPYVEQNVGWIARRAARTLLRAVERLGDEALYWRIFFLAATPKQWNDALRELLERPLPDGEFFGELRRRTPPPERWRWWQLDADVALALYHRSPSLSRPFLERFVDQPGLELFQAAERAGDEEFLDFLSFRLLRCLPGLIYRAFPPEKALRWARSRMKQPVATPTYSYVC